MPLIGHGFVAADTSAQLSALSVRVPEARWNMAASTAGANGYPTKRPLFLYAPLLGAAKFDSGRVFRAIGRWGTVSRRAIDPQSVNAIIKQRAEMAGLEPGEFSAHGLRSGFLTEAANRGIPLPEAMEQSRHRSVQQASSYYNNATGRSGRVARLL
ncbi:integrase [Rhizobium brockwellii]